MSFFQPEHLRTILGGRWLQEPAEGIASRGVSIDAREDLSGKVFVAIKGEHHDGHDYLHDAVRQGSRLLIIHRDEPAQSLPRGIGALKVDDTRRALICMATAYRDELRSTRVIAITGSAGKTTTRRLIHQVLSKRLRGSEAPKSFNNDIGVPLTILNAPTTDDYVVVEIGSNAPGEIATLAAIARPDIAVITTIGRSHLERLGSVQGVAKEKSTLLREITGDGLAIVNADAPLLRPHLKSIPNLLLFGRAPDADLRLTTRGQDDSGWWFEIDQHQRFRLALPGEHNAMNALAVIAVARHMGVPDAEIDQALAQAKPPPMRMTQQRIGSIDLYNDAYNANPDSMQASLHSFAEQTPGTARRVVILGDMLELGDQAPALHREIGSALLAIDRQSPIGLAVLIGRFASDVAQPLLAAWPAERVLVRPDLSDATAHAIAAILRPGDRVLLKGSRGMALERLIEFIRQLHQPAESADSLPTRPAKPSQRPGCSVS